MISFNIHEIAINPESSLLVVILPVAAAFVTFILTKFFDYLFMNKKFQIEVKKVLVLKSMEAHAELITFLKSCQACCPVSSDMSKYYLLIMESKEAFNNFHIKVGELTTNYSYLFDKKLMEELHKLYDYLQLMILLFEAEPLYNNHAEIRKLSMELKFEIFGLIADVQRVAEEFLANLPQFLSWKPYITKPRPYEIGKAPGVVGTKLLEIYTNLKK